MARYWQMKKKSKHKNDKLKTSGLNTLPLKNKHTAMSWECLLIGLLCHCRNSCCNKLHSHRIIKCIAILQQSEVRVNCIFYSTTIITKPISCHNRGTPDILSITLKATTRTLVVLIATSLDPDVLDSIVFYLTIKTSLTNINTWHVPSWSQYFIMISINKIWYHNSLNKQFWCMERIFFLWFSIRCIPVSIQVKHELINVWNVGVK